MAVELFTPEQVQSSVRYDPLTKKGSVYDVIQLVTGQTNASQLFRRITERHPNIIPKCDDVKFPGYKQKPTKAAYLKDLIEIAWLCPGRNAEEFRANGAVTMCRALGGDLSLVEEIRARHQAITAEEQEALLAGTGVTTAEANARAVVPLNPEEQRALKLQNDHKALEIFERMGEASKRLKLWAEEEEDVRHRLFLEDTARNMFMRYASLVTGVESTAVETRLPLTLSDVAAQLGYKKLNEYELSAIGKKAARLYRKKHGRDPPKHAQYVGGAVRDVNSYTTDDRELVEQAVKQAMASD